MPLLCSLRKLSRSAPYFEIGMENTYSTSDIKRVGVGIWGGDGSQSSERGWGEVGKFSAAPAFGGEGWPGSVCQRFWDGWGPSLVLSERVQGGDGKFVGPFASMGGGWDELVGELIGGRTIIV